MGLNPSRTFQDREDDDGSVSPSSSPHRSALTTRSRRPRFSLGPVEDEKVVQLQSHEGKESVHPRIPQTHSLHSSPLEFFINSMQGRSEQSWTWETRYTRSHTLTFASPDSTAYLCMNFPSKLQKRISDAVQSLEALAKNPLFMDTLIIDEIIAFYRDAIKGHRTQLLSIVSSPNDCLSPVVELFEILTISTER